jgi:DNA-binding NarL/FixJ family response regulator
MAADREKLMQFDSETRPPTLLGTETKQRIRIVLVEEHLILREGLKALLEIESDFAVVGEFRCAEDSLDSIRDLQPDLLLTDLSLTGPWGVEWLAEIRRRSPATRKLVLTWCGNAEHIRAALKAGADGYVTKDANIAELMLAIRTASAARQYLCEATANKVLSNFLARGQLRLCPAVAQSITGREREVLTRIALGGSNKLIARELGVSPKTVEKHRSNLMRKLQLHNTAAITMFAIRNGLTGSEPFGGHLAA